MLPRRDREAIVRQVMGVAFAHELGHYLLDTGQHSNRGLLQAALPLRDLSQPERGRLELTPAQQLLMCGSPAR